MAKPNRQTERDIIGDGVVVNHVNIGDVLDVLARLPDKCVQCVVTSPPYWKLRDYKVAGQIGLEKTLDEYLAKMTTVFAEVRRVLKRDGTLWLNFGDSYVANVTGRRMQPPTESESQIRARAASSLKTKDLIGLPWRVAFALQTNGVPTGVEKFVIDLYRAKSIEDGVISERAERILNHMSETIREAVKLSRRSSWYLRSDIIWWKTNAKPESCSDRPPRVHEYLFLMSRSRRYFYNGDLTREPYARDSLLRMLRAHSDKSKGVLADDPRVSNWQSRPRPRRNKMVAAKGAALEGMHVDRAEYDREVELNPRGRLKPSIWPVACEGTDADHYAVFPEDLVKPCILAGSREGDLVLDPFAGTATTGVVALRYRRRFVGIELSPKYARVGEKRLAPYRQQMEMKL